MQRRIGTALAAALMVAAGITVATTSQAPPANAAVTWADEFNAPAGTGVDGGKWNMEVGNNNGNNREHQWYQAVTPTGGPTARANWSSPPRRRTPATTTAGTAAASTRPRASTPRTSSRRPTAASKRA